MVAWAVVASDAGAIETKDDRQAMQCDVVDNLIPRAREERGIERNNGTQATHCHASCRCDCMLFGDADIEDAIGELCLEIKKAGGAWHCCGDGNDAWVEFCFGDQRIAECAGVSGEACFCWAINRVEGGCVVKMLFVVIFGRRVTAAFLCEHVHNDGPATFASKCCTERFFHLWNVVAIERADITNTECFEERWWLEELANGSFECFHSLFGLLADNRNVTQERFDLALATHIDGVEANLGEATRQPVGEAINEFDFVEFFVWCKVGGGSEIRNGGCVAAAVVVQNNDDAAL